MEYRIVQTDHNSFRVDQCAGRHEPWDSVLWVGSYKEAAAFLNDQGIEVVVATGEE